MKISVVYCTARHGGLDVLYESMKHQTFRDFEVIVMDELKRGSIFPEPSFRFIDPPTKKEGMFWNLSASLNEGTRHAKGELIVLLQDYIYVPPDGLQKYWDRYQQEPNSLVSGVSDQFGSPSHVDDPKGMYSCWNTWPGPPNGEKTFKDPRKCQTGFFLTIPLHWEANWGSFPKKAWVDVGGFDERYDAGWGYDNCDFSDRAQHAGYHIFLDTYNEVICYDHQKLYGESDFKAKAPNNCALYNRLERERHKKLTSWKLDYAS